MVSWVVLRGLKSSNFKSSGIAEEAILRLALGYRVRNSTFMVVHRLGPSPWVVLAWCQLPKLLRQ